MNAFLTHPSVRIRGTETNFNPVQCLSASCANKNRHMHCPFCVKAESFHDPVILKAHYLVKHVDKGIEFAGLKILRCCDHCDIVGIIKKEKKLRRSHWHCYKCYNGFNRRDDAIKHYKTHFRKSQTTFQIQIAQEVNQVSDLAATHTISEEEETIHPALEDAAILSSSNSEQHDDSLRLHPDGQQTTSSLLTKKAKASTTMSDDATFQSQHGDMVCGPMTKTDGLKNFKKMFQKLKNEGTISDTDSECEYTIYRWKSGFGAHESIVVGFEHKFFTIEIRLKKKQLILHTEAVPIKKEEWGTCGVKQTTVKELFFAAGKARDYMKGYHFVCSDCQDFVNLFLVAIGFGDQVTETDREKIAAAGSAVVGGVGIGVFLGIALGKILTEEKT